MNPVESTPSAHPGTLDAKSTKTDGCEKKRVRTSETSTNEHRRVQIVFSNWLLSRRNGKLHRFRAICQSASDVLWPGWNVEKKGAERNVFYQRQPFASLSLNSSCHFCHLFLHDFMELDFNRIISRMSCFPLELR